jgi:hypothetical protein
MASENEPNYFGIKKKALQAWHELQEGMDQYPDFPCSNNPKDYTDHDDDLPDGHPPRKRTADYIFSLCSLCPIIDLCHNFAVKNDEVHGIWGGTDFADNENKKLGKLF